MTALQDQLDEITANTRNLVQADRMAVGERAIAELFASGIEDKILPVGAAAPDFALNDATGRLVRSADLLALGPLVIKFIRGRWCPYCVTELEAWRDLHARLRESGALLVAISPQTARQSDFMVGQHALPFPVLSDPGCAYGEKFGLAYTIPEYHRDYYRSVLVNIPFIKGDQSWRLILPATYVLARDGRVVYAQAMPTSASAPSPKKPSPPPFPPPSRSAKHPAALPIRPIPEPSRKCIRFMAFASKKLTVRDSIWHAKSAGFTPKAGKHGKNDWNRPRHDQLVRCGHGGR